MSGKLSRSLITQVALKATEAVWGDKLRSCYKEVDKALSVAMLDYLKKEFPEYKKVMEIAGDYVTVSKCVTFTTGFSRENFPRPAFLDDWNLAWGSLGTILRNKDSYLYKPWSGFDLLEEFPVKSREGILSIPVSKELFFLKIMKPFGDMLLKAADFNRQTLTVLTSAGTVARVHESSPNLLKFFPKERVLDVRNPCSLKLVASVNRALEGVG